MDEASQTTEPIMIGSLFFADKFVLIGDHYQLSPIIQSKAAGDLGTPKFFSFINKILLGMEVSLFERLCNAHPHAVTYLDIQYRMNADIVK